MSKNTANNRPFILIPILTGLALVLLISGVLLLTSYLVDLRANQQLGESLTNIRIATDLDAAQRENQVPEVSVSETDTTVDPFPSEVAGTGSDATADATPATGLLEYVFADNELLPLIRINPETVGWLRIEDTRIDYPVVKGVNNEFYLDHGFDKKPNAAGAVFMDTRNIGDGSDRHTLVYGHRMRDGSMFRDLEKYGEADFYQSHRDFELQTLHGTFRYRVFSVYVTDTDFLFIKTRFKESQYEDFLTQIRDRNIHSDSTAPEPEFALDEQSRILTLATCSRVFEDARFVVHAVLMDTPDQSAGE